MIYSLLRVSANLSEISKSRATANDLLKKDGFIGINNPEKITSWAKPHPNERFVLKADMVLKNAGKFTLFVLRDGKWEKFYSGRVIGVQQSESENTNTFTCISDPFHRILFKVPKEKIADSLEDVQIQAFSKKDEKVDTSLDVSYSDNGQIVHVEVDKIRPFIGQPRTEFDQGKLAQLGQSIQTLGQLKPIDLYVIPPEELTDDGCKYEISFDGQRRWEATKLIKKKTIEAVIKNDLPGTMIERFAKSFVSNIHSEPHTPYEIAQAIIFMHDELKDVARIHEITGYSISTIHGYLKLKSLSPKLLEKMKSSVPEYKRLRVEHAKKISDIEDFQEQERIYSKAYENSGKGNSRVVLRKLNELVDNTNAPKRPVVNRKKKPRHVAVLTQQMITAVREIGSDEDLLRRFIISRTEDSFEEFERDLSDTEKTLSLIRKILSEYKGSS